MDENKICPSLLVECGYLSSAKDISLLSSASSRKQLAEEFLKSIDQYFSLREKNVSEKTSTKPEINILTLPKVAQAKNGNVIIKKEVVSDTNSIEVRANSIDIKSSGKNEFEKALVVLNNKDFMTWQEFEKMGINGTQIKAINILKSGGAKNKYGEKGIDGVIEIFTTGHVVAQGEPFFDKVFTKVEKPPYY